MMMIEFSFHKPPKITEWNGNATKYSYALRNLLLCFCIDGSRKHAECTLVYPEAKQSNATFRDASQL